MKKNELLEAFKKQAARNLPVEEHKVTKEKYNTQLLQTLTNLLQGTKEGKIASETELKEIIKQLTMQLAAQNNFDKVQTEQITLQSEAILKKLQKMNEEKGDPIQQYEIGYNAYINKDYEEALPYFIYLVTKYPYEHRFHFALASTFHAQKIYQVAILFYQQAFSLMPTNPNALYWVAICLLKQEEKAIAIETLELVIEIAELNDEYKSIKARAQQLIKEVL